MVRSDPIETPVPAERAGPDVDRKRFHATKLPPTRERHNQKHARQHLIVRPLLIGQGGKDPWVNQAESEQMVAAIEKNGGRVTYVLYPDEGHGFGRPENRADFYAREEAFLVTYLGGRVEPMAGEMIPGSTVVVRVIGGAK